MREVPLSICERNFILQAISEKTRLDGRQPYDYRRLKITFGLDRGCCNVELGATRVLAQVSCEISQPKQARPTDGLLNINLELSSMAAPHFEAGRMSEYGVELNRLLERCIKESRCVDTESLCIVSGEKVLAIRVDVHVLNHDGNIIDCASIAAITALAHFRRPDVTVSGEDVIVHAPEDREPIPLSIHHMPICVSFSFYELGKYLLVDPTDKEEKVMDGKMVIGMNKHREICTLQMTGGMLLLKDQVLRCSNIAVVKVAEITECIQKALELDSKARSSGERVGFSVAVNTAKLTALRKEEEVIDISEAVEMSKNVIEDEMQVHDDNEENEVVVLGQGTAGIGEGGLSTWGVEAGDSGITGITKEKKQRTNPEQIDLSGELSGDSEEEEIMILDDKDIL